ncbi:hypothetical protein V5799_011144 [Amblyomma americanum]|uniref:Uncharacterized protein n=1 Tax=Amblyomma americanum TaxID=6943 RepID=A0AAQ4EIR4_AMBAM
MAELTLKWQANPNISCGTACVLPDRETTTYNNTYTRTVTQCFPVGTTTNHLRACGVPPYSVSSTYRHETINARI